MLPELAGAGLSAGVLAGASADAAWSAGSCDCAMSAGAQIATMSVQKVRYAAGRQPRPPMLVAVRGFMIAACSPEVPKKWLWRAFILSVICDRLQGTQAISSIYSNVTPSLIDAASGCWI